MKLHATTLLGILALASSTAVHAQARGGAAFTAAGMSCDDVVWSEEALESYPRIASACQDVLQRDGRYFVKFEGIVRRVTDRGQQVTIDFRDGDRLTLTPPENLSIVINGRPTAPRDLRPGDELRFYIPQDQLAATFFGGEPEPATPTAEAVPISPAPPEERVAAAAPARSEILPATASGLPLWGAAGLILVALGAALSARRLLRNSA